MNTNDLKATIAAAQGLHERMGNDLAKLGGVLRSNKCGHEQTMTADQIAAYLRRGWPEHCGHTMRWVTQRELDAGG